MVILSIHERNVYCDMAQSLGGVEPAESSTHDYNPWPPARALHQWFCQLAQFRPRSPATWENSLF
jgi:hypothetical protein